jgi:hypothetical protein
MFIFLTALWPLWDGLQIPETVMCKCRAAYLGDDGLARTKAIKKVLHFGRRTSQEQKAFLHSLTAAGRDDREKAGLTTFDECVEHLNGKTLICALGEHSLKLNYFSDAFQIPIEEEARFRTRVLHVVYNNSK